MTARATRVPRLILVDGFAGSGKSTTAQRLWLHLVGQGHQASWCHEHERGHPIFAYEEVEEILELAPRPFEDRILSNWTALARDGAGPSIRILEGSFFQITVGAMLAMNVSARRIERTLLEIERTILQRGPHGGRTGELDPALIYLFHRSTRDGLLAIRHHRGEYWLNGMAAILARSRYGRRHRVRDVDGLIAFYEMQRTIVDAAFAKLAVRRIAIEISRGQWAHYLQRMAAFLNLGRLDPLTLTRAALLRHGGRYRGTTTGRECVVTTDRTSLYLQGPREAREVMTPVQRLLPAGAGLFCVESLPIQLRFAPGRGVARRMTVENRLLNGRVRDSAFIRCQERRPSC